MTKNRTSSQPATALLSVDASIPKEKIEGSVDVLTSKLAYGWAWLPEQPDSAVDIEILIDNQVIAGDRAIHPRPDVAATGRGTGLYGFKVDFDIGDKNPAQIVVRVSNSDVYLPIPLPSVPEPKVASRGGVVLDEESVQQMIGAAPELAENESVVHFEGHVDAMRRIGAIGWVWSPQLQNQALIVKAFLKGEQVGSSVADLMRPDLAKNGKGTGRYGFRLAFDFAITGNEVPEIRAFSPNGQSKTVPCNKHFPAESANKAVIEQAASASSAAVLRPQIEGHVDELLRSGASGWAWMPADPSMALEVQLLQDGKVLGHAVADQMRPDLKAAGKGSGKYGFRIKLERPVLSEAPPDIRVLIPTRHSLKGAGNLPPLSPIEMRLKERGTPELFTKEHIAFTSRGKDFEEFAPTTLMPIERLDGGKRPVVLAYYLPQFHPILENDKFWGKGFTEWRQISRAVPRFPGHYQPRIPRDLGFYDLRNVDVLKQQAELAIKSGVDVFAYYYYWFDGRRVLEKPLDILLASDVEMPFLLIWANENWTKTWDGFDSDILLQQNYKAEDDEALVADWVKHFSDHRYLRIDGRPLFIIYNPKNIPDAAAKIDVWRRLLKSKYDLEPIIFMAQTFGETDPRPYGLDGAIEFPPHKLSNPHPGRATPDAYSPDFSGRVIDYEGYIRTSLTESEPEFPIIKTIVPSWDNDARRPGRGLTLEGSSPAKYESWMTALIERSLERPVFGVPIVAVNAWNEWAEGAYLEPDVFYGSAYLNATARARNAALTRHNEQFRKLLGTGRESLKVSVIFPNFNHSKYLEKRLRSVIEQTVRPDEIIFLDDCSSDNSLEIAHQILGDCGIKFQIVENETNSGGVFKQWIKGLSLASNEIIWIAETDDYADKDFLYYTLPSFCDEQVLAAFGRITCVDENENILQDLDGYFDDMKDFSWSFSSVVPAFRAFSHDFSIKNVVPNASGLLFRKPKLTEAEIGRLIQYRFAGDWYFYALMLRGGAIAYCSNARSFFRVNRSSASRSAFYSDKHLLEHKMVIEDLAREFQVSDEVFKKHADKLAAFFPAKTRDEIHTYLVSDLAKVKTTRPLHICIAAHSFAVGGGEVLPLELANALQGRGHHVTYLVMEKVEAKSKSIRSRLSSNIPVVYWDDLKHRFPEFIREYGIEILNTHNVGFEYHLAINKIDVNAKYVASLHGGYETVPQILTEEFIAYVNKHVDSWLSLSEKNNTLLLEKGVSSAVFHPSFNALPAYEGERVNRAQFRKEYGIAKDAFVLMICSRAIEEKGWQISINVVKRLAETSSRPVHLVLIGDGPDSENLRARNKDVDCITFLGHVSSPIRYFNCFDMAIFPSTFAGETFPLFLLECFQERLPVVSTNIGGIPNIMGADEARCPGAMVDFKGGSVQIEDNMVNIVGEIIDNKKIYTVLRKNAQKTSERFSIDRLLDLYLDTFRKLL